MAGESPFVYISPLLLEQEAQGRIHSISHCHLPKGELRYGEVPSSKWRSLSGVQLLGSNGITSGGEKISCVYNTV
jgi:hypothetical protein